MSNTRHLGATLCNLITTRQTNQIAFASRAGISQSGLNYIIQGRRPTPETLSAICHAWKDSADGITLIIDHLRDEIERANYKTESIHIAPRYDADNLTTLSETLISAARIDKDIRALLYDLAALITRSKLDINSQTLHIAADPDGPAYNTKRKRKT